MTGQRKEEAEDDDMDWEEEEMCIRDRSFIVVSVLP